MRPVVTSRSRVDENALGKVKVFRKRCDMNWGMPALAVTVIEKHARFPSVVKKLVKLGFAHHTFIRSFVKLGVKIQIVFVGRKIPKLVEWLVQLLPQEEGIFTSPPSSVSLPLPPSIRSSPVPP